VNADAVRAEIDASLARVAPAGFCATARDAGKRASGVREKTLTAESQWTTAASVVASGFCEAIPTSR